MVQQEKVRLMTDLAIYEKKNESEVFKINNYYRSDYILWQILLAFVRYSFCFLVLLCLYVIFKADTLFYNINLSGITETFFSFGRYYIAGLLIYLGISWAVADYRYKKARKGILLYATKLKRLARRYHYDDDV